jgi:murein L,D-transpeptidase YcbB/YkuD
VRGAESHGLDPGHYHLEALAAAGGGRPGDPAAAADLDLLRTDALLRLARDLRFGKVEPAERQPTPAVAQSPAGEEAGVRLEELFAAADLGRALEALAPNHHAYRGLRRALARYRSIRDAGGFPVVGEGPGLRLGDVDPRVPWLRLRLLVTGDLPPDADLLSSVIDADLEVAVRRFQHRHGLNDDAVVGTATLAELEVPVERRIEQVRVNLERARWILRDLPASFVVVNVAGQRLYVVHDGAAVWETRVIVGKTATRTPTFSALMRYVVLNPAWSVPRSIAPEILADLRRNPSYLEEQGYRVLDPAGGEVDPSTVEFERYRGSDFPYLFRQSPGTGNALGRIKFEFPNPYSVYLHDTPARSLFERERRTFSHGCIRVQDPLRLGELVLDDPERWSREALEAAIATRATRTVPLKQPLPVLILYWTAAADLHGELHFYRDVYGRDPALLRALGEP